MGGEILDYKAKRIRNESNIEAVYNMLVANVDESVVQQMYPEQFEAGKKRFVSTCPFKMEIGCMCNVAERLERKGIEKGRLSEIFDSAQSEDYSVERGAQKANMSIPEFEKAMESAGYNIAR